MRGKRKQRLLLVLSFLVTILTVGFIYSTSMAANKSPDLNGDRVVNMKDVVLLSKAFNTTPANTTYKAEYDLNSDKAINMKDVVIIAGVFNTTISATDTPTPTNTPTNTATNTPTSVVTADPTKKNETNLAGDIIFSNPGKAFKDQITVTLSSKVANAQIRYTTNGSVPNSSSTLYSSALTFTKTTQLRAQSFVNGAASGEMGTALYVASSIDTKHDLPVMIIDLYGGGKPAKQTDKNCAVIVLEPENKELSLLQDSSLAARAAIHIRGQSSANYEKAPYKIELHDNEEKDAKHKVLGLGLDGDWALLSPFVDKSLIRNAFTYSIGEEAGLQAPGFRHVEVYINTDNQPLSADDYQGVYLLVETPEIQKNRLDIAKLKETDLTEPNISGGYLMQFNMQAAEAPVIKGSGWSDLELTEPRDAKPAQITWITNYIQKTQNAIHSSNPSNPTTGYPAYIDVDSFMNYIIIQELGHEVDAYIRSGRIYKDREKKLCAGPLWDHDLSYDGYSGGGFGGPSSSIQGWQFASGGMFGTTCDWFATLMKDASFQSKINARWKELRKGPLSDANMLAKVRELTAPLTNAAKRNFQKWPNLNTKQLGGFSTQTTQTWEQQITILENYLTKRAAWLDTSGWKP